MHERVERLRAWLRAHGLDGLVVVQPENRRYLSGFTGSAGILVISGQAAICVADSRYWAQVERQAPGFRLERAPVGQPLEPVVAGVLAALGLRRVGIEAAAMSVATLRLLEHSLKNTAVQFDPLDQDPTAALRERKDPAELAVMRQAIALTDAALAAVLPELTPTMTEREAAWRLEVAMRTRGAEAVAFPIIVAAGENSANPHARPGDAPLGQGQPIVIDMGARVDGYHADLTRTILLGEPDARFRELYALVAGAQQAALNMLRAGVTGQSVDQVARDHFARAGYGEQFAHSLGHGVGLAVHEGPALRVTNQAALPDGAVVSVEPGLYLPGWGGIRIEDLALITRDGCEVLSGATK